MTDHFCHTGTRVISYPCCHCQASSLAVAVAVSKKSGSLHLYLSYRMLYRAFFLPGSEQNSILEKRSYIFKNDKCFICSTHVSKRASVYNHNIQVLLRIKGCFLVMARFVLTFPCV
jgi:hypothetical protein